jgi:putative ABC transport system ATP-binding protein
MTHTRTHAGSADSAVELRAVSKHYGGRSAAVTALDGVTPGFGRRGFTAVMGPSGSGKSTLLHCAADLAGRRRDRLCWTG